jgi:hypothetical protein
MKAAAALLGLLMLAVPALSSSAQVLTATGAGVLLVVASVVNRSGWRESAGTIAAAIAVIQCAAWRPGTISLAIEGLLMAGYLILLNGPWRAGRPVTTRWLLGQLPSGIAALTAVGVILTALAVRTGASSWIFLIGLAAAAAGYRMALPRRPRSTR